MKDVLKNRYALFVENRNLLSDAFRWQNGYIHPLCASYFAMKGVEADAQRMKDCREILKEKTSAFSPFRGLSELAVVGSLCLSPDPEEKMERLLEAYDRLREQFHANSYLPIAACILVDQSRTGDYRDDAGLARMIHDRARARHPFLATGKNVIFATLLALYRRDAFAVEEETERCYELLKEDFRFGGAFTLSQALTLEEGDCQEKCRRVVELFRYLENRGYNYGRQYELPALAVFALFPGDIDSLARDMMEGADYLKGKKGFGSFGVGGRQRLMYAGILALDERKSAGEDSRWKGGAAAPLDLSALSRYAAFYAAVASGEASQAAAAT